LQPDEGQDETPTLEKTPPVIYGEVNSLEVDTNQTNVRVETTAELTIQQSDASDSAVKNHTSPVAIDHTLVVDRTSPTSPCSTKSTDDNGEQKLSTPGAASSGYGSAVLTQTTSSDDLLGDHAAADDIGAERRNANSMVVTAEVNIIDAAVPVDLDSPLKPTTPYTDEPSMPATSNDTSILHSSVLNAAVAVNNEPEVSDSSQDHSAVSCSAISNLQSSVKTDSENVDVVEPSEDEVLDLVKQSDTAVDGGKNESGDVTESLSNGDHALESVPDSPSGVCHHTSSDGHTGDGDAGIVDADGPADAPSKPQSADKPNVKSLGSLKASHRPVSMPPEMTIIEDQMTDITTLGN